MLPLCSTVAPCSAIPVFIVADVNGKLILSYLFGAPSIWGTPSPSWYSAATAATRILRFAGIAELV